MGDGSVRIRGNAGRDFADLAATFRRLSARGLQKELYSAGNRAARPGITAAKRRATQTLPSGGGKDRRVRALRVTARVDIDGQTFVRRKLFTTNRTREPESLAQRVAGASFSVKPVRGSNPTIRVTARAKSGKPVNLQILDDGKVRHPLFGNRAHWYDQLVIPKWFSGPMNDQADTFRTELERVIEKLRAEIEKR